MAMYELDGNHLLPVRLGRSADAITLSHSLVAIQRQIVDVLRRPLFPLAWDEVNGGRSLTALGATGQVVVVEVLERVDSAGLLAAMSRLTTAAAAGRRDIAGRYAGGLGAFSKDWNEFREAMPAQVEPGPRLTILSASLEPDVVGGLGVLASSGLEIHEVDVRIVDESRIVVVVEKISGTDLAVGGPLLVARAPRPALSGSAGPTGSRAINASEQAEHMSPVTGPIEIVLPPQAAGDTEDGSDGAAVPPGAFAATGAADALSDLFEPVAVTTEQPRVNVPAAEGRTGDRAEGVVGGVASKPDDDAADDPAGDPATGSVDSAGSSGFDGAPVLEPNERSTARVLPEPTESTPTLRATVGSGNTDVAKPGAVAQGSADESAGKAGAGSPGVPETGADDVAGDQGDGEEADPDSAASSVTNVSSTSSAHGPSRPVDHSAGRSTGGDAGGADSDRDLADILSGDSLIGPAAVDLGDGPAVDGAGRSGSGSGTGVGDGTGGSGGEPGRAGHADRSDADHSDRTGDADDDGAGARAVTAPAEDMDILGRTGLSASGGSAAAATVTDSEGGAVGDDRSSGDGDTVPSGEDHPGRQGRRGHAGQRSSETPSSVRAAKAWSTVPPHENLPDDPTGVVPPVSWEPLRGSADAPGPVAEALGEGPSKSLVVQETAELAAVAASLGKPTQLIWQRLRRGIYHEAMLSVEGVITLSDGRSFTDPTSAANAAQDVSDADGWRVWRVGARGAHLGDLRDDLADRSS